MKRRMVVTWAVVLTLLASSCRSSPTPFITPTPSPVVSGSPTAPHRAGVVLLALDGARPDWVASHMQNGSMPNLAALAQRGVMAAYMQTVDPTLAAPAYLSLSTGTFPSQSGLVSDKYHTPQQPFQEYSGALSQVTVEPIWRTAMRNGLKTAVLFWPSTMLGVAELHADYTVVTASSDVPSAQHVLTFQEAKGWEAPPYSFSPLREAALRIASREGSIVATFNVLSADSTDDDVSNYDLLIIDSDKNLTNDHAALQLGQWAPLTVSPRLHSGSYICFTASSSVTATLYTSQVNYNQARPDDLLRAVNAKFGFPPPAPDVEALRAGWISPQQFCEMAELKARWMMDVVLYVYQSHQPNLLLTMQSIIAECASPFLLVDERQEAYTPEQAALYASYLQKAHQTADENLGRLLGLVNLADSAVLVVSGPGLMPVHTTVRLNTILKNAALLQLKTVSGQDKVDEKKSKALAFASGGSAHIYINLQGREQPGLVPPDDYAKVQQQIIQALEETKGADGQPVFARILKREDLKSIHLESPNSGDVFVQAAPGYCLSDELGFRKVLTASLDRAARGFEATLPEMHGIFVAAGNNLLSGKSIPAVRLIDVAPTVAKVLRVELPNTVAGNAVEEIWR